MEHRSKPWRAAAISIALLLVILSQNASADNRFQLRRTSDDKISVELANMDAIAGIQFSINARGGVRLSSFESGDRAVSAGIGVYQFLKDDSTLNVVLLAPVRSTLPAGTGILGVVSMCFTDHHGSDTAKVYLSRVVLCDVAAQYLEVSTSEVSWGLRSGSDQRTPTFSLEQNFPNPFNPSTMIRYKVESPEHVHLAVYDITGRKVATLVDQYQSEGTYAVQWDTRVAGSSSLASGIYFARLQVGGQCAVKKMIFGK